MANLINNKIVSPIMEHGDGHVFHVAGGNFKVTGSHIQQVSETSDLFNTLVAANEAFTINERSVSFYYDYNGKQLINKVEEGAEDNFEKINDLNERVSFLRESVKELKLANKTAAIATANAELTATEELLAEAKTSSTAIKFTYNNENNTYSAGKVEIVLSQEESIVERCFAVGYIKYEDKALMEAFKIAAENFDTFKVLDFVTESENDDVKVITMRAENNAFVYRFNESTKISKFSKLLADAAIEYVAEQTGADVTDMFEDVLASLGERRAAKNDKISLYKEMISFLHDQKGRLAEADRNLPDIKAADNLLKSEIKRISEELNELQNEDLLNIEDGYVDAELKVESDGLAAGQKLKVDSVEFTQAGKNDILTVFVKDEPRRIEKFKIQLDGQETV